jgi:hypothetical protein
VIPAQVYEVVHSPYDRYFADKNSFLDRIKFVAVQHHLFFFGGGAEVVVFRKEHSIDHDRN